jgi:hypothetical protein
MKIVERLAARPEKGLPQVMRDASQLENAYRFFGNENVKPEALFAAHAEETVARAAKAARVVVAHDTTMFVFGGERKTLGRLVGKGRGFLGHFALAIDGATSMPLGVAHCEPVLRADVKPEKAKKKKTKKDEKMKDEPKEALRWNRAASAVHEALPGAVHVMDREADSYALLEEMLRRRQDFVVRLSQRSRRAEGGAIGELVLNAPVVAEREVGLGARKPPVSSPGRKRQPARVARTATLEISAHRRAELLRPSDCAANYSPRIVINVVRVVEKTPPAGEEPVEWLLYTSLPVETKEQVLAAVDAYRQRWLIEEFFKALKTGCSYEERQLESTHGLLLVLAISVPIAWHMLRLRTLVRTDPEAPAASIASPSQLACLRHELGPRALPARPNARDVLLAIAQLGGHLRNNGDPGWLTLARGLDELYLLERGYLFHEDAGDQS